MKSEKTSAAKPQPQPRKMQVQHVAQLNPRIAQPRVYRQVEVPQAQPSTLHLQQKNRPKKNPKIYKNKDLVVKRMPILQIVSGSGPDALNRDMPGHHFQIAPQFLVENDESSGGMRVVRHK
jgi:hypothetical protein